MTIFRDLGSWFWHLLPANPILVRVVTSGGKRARHHWARVTYLVVLFVVLLVMGNSLFGAQRNSLADLAKQSTNTFMYVSVVQLFLMCFIAPIFTAGAITQEKDSNTFNILLTTPLSSAQIIIGSLFSRLYFVWVLLLAGLPIFCITMIFGGVTRAEVFNSFGLAACTALLTGSLAILISVAKVGTRRTIFSFFMGIAIYLLALQAIGMSPYGQLIEATPPPGSNMQMSWLAPVHPFLALLVVTGQTPPPALDRVAHYGWPYSWMLAAPHKAYMVLTTLTSMLLIAFSLAFVRKGMREGEVTWANKISAFFTRGEAATERRRKPRNVWNNPIAWREAATRASAGGRSALRWCFIAAGILGGLALLIAHERGSWGMNPSNPISTRYWLVAVVWIELLVILLVVTNTAASTLTRERESETMELLLTTELTSRYIIAGMLRGLVSFVIPLITVPTATLLFFGLADLFRTSTPAVTTLEAALLAPALLIAFAAAAAMTGLYFSLQYKKTVQAVMVSTGAVMLIAGIAYGCGMALADAGHQVAGFLRPASPLHALQVLIDPLSAFSELNRAKATPDEILAVRVTRGITSVIAIGVYAGLTYMLYTSMVRNFDMTVRRQSA
ncbi:MAG: ABC transporter permease [Phycisphaerae bacterium]